jgi:monoamine oxidase
MKPSEIARLARQMGATADPWTRRQFLRTTLAGGAGLFLSGRTGFGQRRRPGSKPRVLIIGAGFSGLACAFELQGAGADVIVLEARGRLGGRVLSMDSFIKKRVVEAGGELIGSNHPTWATYAGRFGLHFDDVLEPEAGRSPIMLNGCIYQGEALVELWNSIRNAMSLLNKDARTVNLNAPWNTLDAGRLDHLSLEKVSHTWSLDGSTRQGLLALIGNDNAASPKHESYLGVIASVAGGGVEQYWTETEVFRCRGGNQRLALKLATAIGLDRIHLTAPVEQIHLGDHRVTLSTAGGATFEGDIVVLTVPPSAWKNFSVNPKIPSTYQVQAGPAVKYLSSVKRPFWLADGLSANSMSNGPIGATWEGTEAQRTDPTDPACLTVFSGGLAAQRCLAISPKVRTEILGRRLEKIYPGYLANVDRSMFMNWPADKYTLCGYTTPAVGEVTTKYPLLREGFADRMYFAGEYTSLLFPGYMEGGLHSGATLAKRLAQKVNLV